MLLGLCLNYAKYVFYCKQLVLNVRIKNKVGSASKIKYSDYDFGVGHLFFGVSSVYLMKLA